MLVSLDTIAPGKIPSIRVSADPVQPKEAIDWFGKKTPLDKPTWLTLSAGARKRAFTAAWVTDLNVLQSVKDSLKQAIESGESFESWKTRIRSELGERWKRDNPYLETVFRNNVQSAYAAGRYKAQTTPLILRMRPFWRLVVILDARTSEICSRLAKPPVVLPAEHPWWAAHWPPLHHRCRTTTVSMSQRQAERVGILKHAPSVAAQEGWGSTKGLGEWQPDGKSIDPKIFEPAKKAGEKTPEPKPEVKPPAQVPEIKAPPPAPKEPAKKPAKSAPEEAPKPVPTFRLDDLKPRNIDHLPFSGGKVDMTKESLDLLEKHATVEEREAIRQYTGSLYKAIRAYESGMSDAAMRERYGDIVTDAAQKASPLIASAFRKVPAAPMIVYRGLSEVPRQKVVDILEAGGFETEASTSTSRDPTAAKDFSNHGGDNYAVVYIIRQRSGIPIEGISRYPSEREILVAKGKRFRILTAHRDADDPRRVIIEVEEV